MLFSFPPSKKRLIFVIGCVFKMREHRDPLPFSETENNKNSQILWIRKIAGRSRPPIRAAVPTRKWVRTMDICSHVKPPWFETAKRSQILNENQGTLGMTNKFAPWSFFYRRRVAPRTIVFPFKAVRCLT